MASRSALPEEDLTCPVCIDIFKDPVVLSCGHSFCRDCLQKDWTQNGLQQCSVCRIRASSSDPPRNMALKNLCEAFLLERSQRAAASSGGFCSLHGENLKLFCLEDEEPICLVCQVSWKHKTHNGRPIEEVVNDYQLELVTNLSSLEEKQKLFMEFKETFEQTAGHIKRQAQQTERQIKKEFERLHQFLSDEEEVRTIAVREENNTKSQMIKEKIEKITKEMLMLSESIAATTQAIASGDITVLQTYKSTMERTQRTLQDPDLGSGALIDVAKHLSNLKYKVWEKMGHTVQYAPVTLDPNTANPKLVVSADLTSVTMGDQIQQFPDNPERISGWEGVLGSVGFSSGTPCWDVEVGDNSDWILGVADESIIRKIPVFANPENGFWTLTRYDGKYQALTSTGTTLTVRCILHSVRVQLDWDRGEVSFFDPQNNTHLFTFTHRFTHEKVFPYFYTTETRGFKILLKSTKIQLN